LSEDQTFFPALKPNLGYYPFPSNFLRMDFRVVGVYLFPDQCRTSRRHQILSLEEEDLGGVLVPFNFNSIRARFKFPVISDLCTAADVHNVGGGGDRGQNKHVTYGVERPPSKSPRHDEALSANVLRRG